MCLACHDAHVLPYAAYLRVYEPLTAFAEPERSGWARYAESDDRPRRVSALGEEHLQAVRRLAARPPVVVPAGESPHAYVRRWEGETFICPWQTRLRSWVAFDRFRDTAPAGGTRPFVPDDVAGRATEDFEQWKRRYATIRPYIQSSTWQVPVAWFMPFTVAERWLTLGPPPDTGAAPPARPAGRGAPSPGLSPPPTALPTRTLIYVTSMAHARRRVFKAIMIVRATLGEGLIYGQVEALGRWLTEFHPLALVELDYGGLVHLLDDQALRADESVTEVAAALAGMEQGERELTVAMYARFFTRWRLIRALESAN
ncbi:MAG: hypothetical protein QOE54_3444 [Streptosporangiaceae bacterium]|nr:hypothetical protein [Streptosporangiaceae bacterium]